MANEQQVKLDKTAVAIYNRVLKEKNNTNWYDIIDNGLYLKNLSKDKKMLKQIENVIKNNQTQYGNKLKCVGDYISFTDETKKGLTEKENYAQVAKKCQELLIKFLEDLSKSEAFNSFQRGSDYAGKSYKTAFDAFIKKLNNVKFRWRKSANGKMNAVMKSLSLKGAVSGKNSDEMIKLAKTINDSVFSFRSEVSKMIDDLIEENEKYQKSADGYGNPQFSSAIGEIVKKKNIKLKSIRSYLLKEEKEEAAEDKKRFDDLMKERDDAKN